MSTRLDLSKLTLMDALDLASLIALEATKRYTEFAESLGSRGVDDAGAEPGQYRLVGEPGDLHVVGLVDVRGGIGEPRRPSADAAMDARLKQRDDAGLADVLPRQAKHQGIVVL